MAAWPLLLLVLISHASIVHSRAVSSQNLKETENENDDTRRVLGSSVVTSVSVIMDLGNGNQAVYADATGRPVPKPSHSSNLASPPHLMAPDRYEFYTFNDAGDLVKRLMTLEEIQGLIAGESVEIGSDLPGIEADEIVHVEDRPPAFFFLPRPVEQSQDWAPPAVDKVVANVQSILNSMKDSANVLSESEPSWSILPITTHNPLEHSSIPTEKIPLFTLVDKVKPNDSIKDASTTLKTTSTTTTEKPTTITQKATTTTEKATTTTEKATTTTEKATTTTEKATTTTEKATTTTQKATTEKATTTTQKEATTEKASTATKTITTAQAITTKIPQVTTSPLDKNTEKATKHPQLSTFIPIISNNQQSTTISPTPEFTLLPATPTDQQISQIMQSLMTSTNKPSTTSLYLVTKIPSTQAQVITTTLSSNKPEIKEENKVESTTESTTYIPVKLTTPQKVNDAAVTESSKINVTSVNATKPAMSSPPEDLIADNILSINQISNALLDQTLSMPYVTTEKVTSQLSITLEPQITTSLLSIINNESTGSNTKEPVTSKPTKVSNKTPAVTQSTSTTAQIVKDEPQSGYIELTSLKPEKLPTKVTTIPQKINPSYTEITSLKPENVPTQSTSTTPQKVQDETRPSYTAITSLKPENSPVKIATTTQSTLHSTSEKIKDQTNRPTYEFTSVKPNDTPIKITTSYPPPQKIKDEPNRPTYEFTSVKPNDAPIKITTSYPPPQKIKDEPSRPEYISVKPNNTPIKVTTSYPPPQKIKDEPNSSYLELTSLKPSNTPDKVVTTTYFTPSSSHNNKHKPETMQHSTPHSKPQAAMQTSTAANYDYSEEEANKISTPVLSIPSTSYVKPDIVMDLTTDMNPAISSSTIATFGISTLSNKYPGSSSNNNNFEIPSSFKPQFTTDVTINKKPGFTTESYTELSTSGESTFVPLLTASNNPQKHPTFDTLDYPSAALFDVSEEEATSKTSEIELTSEFSLLPHNESSTSATHTNKSQENIINVTSPPSELFDLLSEITGEMSSEEGELETTYYPNNDETNIPFTSQIPFEKPTKPELSDESSVNYDTSYSVEEISTTRTLPSTTAKPSVDKSTEIPKPSSPETLHTTEKSKTSTGAVNKPSEAPFNDIAPDVNMNAIAGILDMITGNIPHDSLIYQSVTPSDEPSQMTSRTPSTTLRLESDESDASDFDSTEGYERITTLQPSDVLQDKIKPIISSIADVFDEDMFKITTFVPQQTTETPTTDVPLSDMVENVDLLESINAMKSEEVDNVTQPSVEDSSSEYELISTTQFSVKPTIMSHASTIKIQTLNITNNNNKPPAFNKPTVNIPLSIPNSPTVETYLDSGVTKVTKIAASTQKLPEMQATTIPSISISSMKESNNSSASTTAKPSFAAETSKPNKTEENVFVKISTLQTDKPEMKLTTPTAFDVQTTATGTPIKQQRPVDTDNFVDSTSSESNEKFPDLEVSWQEPQEVVWTMVHKPSTTSLPEIQSTLLSQTEKIPSKKPTNTMNIVVSSKNNHTKVEELIVDKILESFMGNEVKTDLPVVNPASAVKTTPLPPVFVPIEESTVKVATVSSVTTTMSPSQKTTSETRPITERTKSPMGNKDTSFTKYIPDTEHSGESMELVSTSNTEYEKMSTIPAETFFNVPANSQFQPEVSLEPASSSNLGLEATTVALDEDVRRFIDLNNDVAIRMFKHITSDLDKKRSIVLSPFGATSLMAMVFLGARGQTSAQMNDFLPLDDMITFNPHLVFRNITDTVIMSPDLKAAALVRQLYSQQSKGKLLDFYKARASAFYDGIVQEVEFEEVSDVVRQRTNELVRTHTSDRVPNFLSNTATLRLRPPLAALSANVFQMNCKLASSQGRNAEMQFHGERPGSMHSIPSSVWTGQFLIGYDTGLDATAVELPHSSSPGGALTSAVFVMPGRPGSRGGTPLLARLEARLISRRAWSGLLRNLVRSKSVIEVQIPRFEHRSVLNLTAPFKRMGLRDLFNEERADLKGINGIQDLYLTDIMQVNAFSACSDPNAEGHVETYPTSRRTGRLGSRVGDDDEDDNDWRKVAYRLPLALRPRQARIPIPSDVPRFKVDRPFLYFVRHNPTGMILHMGRFNPRFTT